MRSGSGLRTNARAVLTAFAAFSALSGPVTRAADATDRTAMPDFCSNRNVTCVLPDGPAPRLRARAPSPGDPSIVITAPVGSTSTGAGGVGGTPTVPSVPALPGQVPSLPGGVPALSGQVPALPAQVPSLSGSVPALPAQVPSTTTSTTSAGTTSSSGGTASTTGTATGGTSNAVPGSTVSHGRR